MGRWLYTYNLAEKDPGKDLSRPQPLVRSIQLATVSEAVGLKSAVAQQPGRMHTVSHQPGERSPSGSSSSTYTHNRRQVSCSWTCQLSQVCSSPKGASSCGRAHAPCPAQTRQWIRILACPGSLPWVSLCWVGRAMVFEVDDCRVARAPSTRAADLTPIAPNFKPHQPRTQQLPTAPRRRFCPPP